MTAPTIPGLEPSPTIPDQIPTVTVGGHAKPGTCRCHAHILVGYDSHVMAAHATVDPNRLTPQLDAAAWVLQRPTWTLWGRPGTYRLTARTWPGVPNYWPAKPATEYTIVTRHECNRPLGGTPIRLLPETNHLMPDSEPEF